MEDNVYDKEFKTTINYIGLPGGIKKTEKEIDVTVHYNAFYPIAGITVDTPSINNGMLELYCVNYSKPALNLNYEIHYEDGSERTSQVMACLMEDDFINLVQIVPKRKGINVTSIIINIDDIDA